MKYIAVLLVAGGIYMTLTHPRQETRVSIPGITGPAGQDFLKDPLDRTHEVLDQAKTRAADPALQ